MTLLCVELRLQCPHYSSEPAVRKTGCLTVRGAARISLAAHTVWSASRDGLDTTGVRLMKHERLRQFNTRDVYPNQTLDNDMCMVVKAGHRIFMRGQTGLDLNQRLVAPEDAAAQADQ